MKQIAAVVALGCCTLAVGCGKAEYERRLKNTVFELTQQASTEESGEVPAEDPAPAN